MKKLSILLSLFVLFTTFNCTNEALEGEFGNENPTTGSFTVDFDGETYVADVVSAAIIGSSMNITAKRGDQEELVTITLQETTVGTYNLGLVDATTMLASSAAYSEANGSSNTWVAFTNGTESVGTITISEINEIAMTMSGTFSFTAYNGAGDAKEFTNGVFNEISYINTLQDIPTDNSFFAKVDGVEFVEDLVAGVSTSLAGFNTISISATKNSGETIGFSLDAAITQGTYDFVLLPLSPTDVIGIYNLSTTETYVANGSITITTHDVVNKRIIASFEFTADPSLGSATTGSFEITEGEFDIVYQ